MLSCLIKRVKDHQLYLSGVGHRVLVTDEFKHYGTGVRLTKRLDVVGGRGDFIVNVMS